MAWIRTSVGGMDGGGKPSVSIGGGGGPRGGWEQPGWGLSSSLFAEKQISVFDVSFSPEKKARPVAAFK